MRCSEELGADLIAMGGHGGVSHKVTHRSERPVLIVRKAENYRTQEKFGTA